MIMHNMIIEKKRGTNAVYSIYDLMGHQVRLWQGGDRVARFLDAYHHIRDLDVHENLQNYLTEEWWK
jgi:hypothetical protein